MFGFRRRSKSGRRDMHRRCMTCKYWEPETEWTGKCTKTKSPIYKLPNYCCDKWEFWKS